MLPADHSLRSLIGRRREVRTLTGFLDARESGVLVVTGPFGIGKSALVSAALAEAGATPVTLRYTRGTGPYRTALDLLHGSAGALDPTEPIELLRRAAADPVRADAGRIVDRLAGFLAERSVRLRPVVIVHEDVELADPETQRLCAEFLRRAGLWPWSHLVLIDSRSASVLAGHPVLEVGRLEHAEVRALLRETVRAPVAARVAHRLAEACDGNPKLLRAYAWQLTPEQLAGAAPLPRRFAPPVETTAREAETIKDLGPAELTALALFDDHRRVPWPVADRVAGDPARVARLRRLDLIFADGEHWRPAGPTLGAAAKARLSAADQDRMQQCAAAAFRAIGDERAALLHECQLRVQPAETAEELIGLACADHERGDLESADRLLDLAAARPGFDVSARFHAIRARNLLEQGHLRAALAEVEDGLDRPLDPRSEFWLRVTGLEAVMLLGEDDPGLLSADWLPPGYPEPAGEHAWLTLRAAQLLGMTGAVKEARLVLERSGLERSGLEGSGLEGSGLEGSGLEWPGPEWPGDDLAAPGTAGLHRAVEGLLACWEQPTAPAPDPAGLDPTAAARPVPVSLIAGLADVLVTAGRSGEARRLVGRVLADPSRHTVLTDVHLVSALVSIDLWEGRYQVAERRIAELERTRPGAADLPPLAGAAARVRAAFGHPDPAERVARLRPRQPGAPVVAPFDADLGYCHLVQGHYGSAATCLDAALRAGQPLHQGLAEVLADLVEALVALGRTRQATEAVGWAARRDLDLGCVRTAALVARCRALTAEPDESAAAADRALELCGDAVPAVDRARTLIALGRVRQRAGDPAGAEDLLRDGRDLMRHLGLAGWVDHADRLLSRPAPPAPAPVDPWRQVVRDRDRTLLAGIAAGLTHDQLARSAYVSRRTVANSLKTIYELTGVQSKSELAALLRRNPPAWVEQPS